MIWEVSDVHAIYSMNKSWVQKFFDKSTGIGFGRISRDHLSSGHAEISVSYILVIYWKAIEKWKCFKVRFINVDGLWKFLQTQLDVEMRILVETVEINQPKFAVWRR